MADDKLPYWFLYVTLDVYRLTSVDLFNPRSVSDIDDVILERLKHRDKEFLRNYVVDAFVRIWNSEGNDGR